MAKLAFALTALFAFYSFTSHASSPVLSSYSLSRASAGELKAVAEVFGLEHRRGEVFEVEVPAAQASLLLTLAPDAELIEADVAQALRTRLAGYSLRAEEGYHSFDEVQAWLHRQAAASRGLLSVRGYGTSRGGRKLTLLRLASPKSAGKPAVMITAATHGDELITTEVLIDLVEKLVAGYGKDDRLTKLIDSHELYFIPVVNPDGFANTERFDGSEDPNRSYPWPGRENAVPTPSIAALMQLVSTIELKASIDFHAFGELIMYPWAFTRDPVEPVAGAKLYALTSKMADSNHYRYGPIADVIYISPGSSADYYFWKKGSLSLGIEMDHEKVPDPEEFPEYFASQEESTWRFLEGI